MSMIRTTEMQEWERDLPQDGDTTYIHFLWDPLVSRHTYRTNTSNSWMRVCAELGMLTKDEAEAEEVANFLKAMLKIRTEMKAAWERNPNSTNRDGYYVEGASTHSSPILFMVPNHRDYEHQPLAELADLTPEEKDALWVLPKSQRWKQTEEEQGDGDS